MQNRSWSDPVARVVARPFQAFIGLICVPVGAIAIVVGQRVSLSISLLLYPGLVRAWGAVLLVGGAMMICGVMLQRSHIERVGLGLLGPALALYGITVYAALGIGGIVAGSLSCAAALACFVKASDLSHKMKIVGTLQSAREHAHAK